jgi:hypothetical protein
MFIIPSGNKEPHLSHLAMHEDNSLSLLLSPQFRQHPSRQIEDIVLGLDVAFKLLLQVVTLSSFFLVANLFFACLLSLVFSPSSTFSRSPETPELGLLVS